MSTTDLLNYKQKCEISNQVNLALDCFLLCNARRSCSKVTQVFSTSEKDLRKEMLYIVLVVRHHQ